MKSSPDILKNLTEYKTELPRGNRIYISSVSYRGEVCYVSDRINGHPLYRWSYSPGLNAITIKRGFLAGVFLGIELSPRFLLIREDDTLFYFSDSGAMCLLKRQTTDEVFEGTVGMGGLIPLTIAARYWRIP